MDTLRRTLGEVHVGSGRYLDGVVTGDVLGDGFADEGDTRGGSVAAGRNHVAQVVLGAGPHVFVDRLVREQLRVQQATQNAPVVGDWGLPEQLRITDVAFDQLGEGVAVAVRVLTDLVHYLLGLGGNLTADGVLSFQDAWVDPVFLHFNKIANSNISFITIMGYISSGRNTPPLDFSEPISNFSLTVAPKIYRIRHLFG